MRRATTCKIICNSCQKQVDSWVHNRKYCDECKSAGVYTNICKNCNIEFRTNRPLVKYCKTCSEGALYLKGKTRPPEVVEKINESRKSWLESQAAEEHYKTLGKHNSINLKQYFRTPEGQAQIKSVAKIQSILMKEKIKNGDFVPNITNSFTHWDATIIYNGQERKFRSSWEACFWLSNPFLEYETIRVPRKNGSSIIVDFVDMPSRIIYELKPVRFWNKQQEKMDELIDYCVKNDYIFKWINENNILQYIDKDKFDEVNLPQYEKMLNGISQN